MPDRDTVINGLTELKKYLPSTMWGPINNAIAMLKELQQRLDSIVCFENGDQVRTWHCPRCGDDIRFVINGWNIVEDNLLGLKRIVERPQDIRVETDDGRIIVLKKEIPTMVLSYKEGGET